MAEKLLLFGIGYVMGTRAGRQRYEELVSQAKQLAQRDEVRMVITMALGFLEERADRMVRGGLLRAA